MTTTKSPYLFEGQGSAIDDYYSPKQQLQNVVKAQSGNWGLFDKTNQQHKTVLSLMRQAQWTVPSDKWGEVPDLNRLSDFLKSDKSPVNLPLKKMKPEAVSKIIEALKGIVKSKYK
jgi:hypothetical protein